MEQDNQCTIFDNKKIVITFCNNIIRQLTSLSNFLENMDGDLDDQILYLTSIQKQISAYKELNTWKNSSWLLFF